MDWDGLLKLMPAFLDGTWVSLKLFFITLLLALPLGILIMNGRRSKHKIICAPIAVFQWVIRGTPLMLQLVFVMYFPSIVLGLQGMDRFFAACVAFVVNYAAYFSEIYRSGIESIPVGQYEASKVLGLSKGRTFFRIILPQTVKRILPSMGNEFMTLVKDTALASIIGNIELLRVATTQMNRSASMVPLLAAGVFYLLMNGVVQLAMGRAEKKLSYYKG
ncbi:MAG: amino acid ABC transporter permease [Fastidiosipilaceae bacterium]|jgi:polar amino acid transport system permease protein